VETIKSIHFIVNTTTTVYGYGLTFVTTTMFHILKN